MPVRGGIALKGERHRRNRIHENANPGTFGIAPSLKDSYSTLFFLFCVFREHEILSTFSVPGNSRYLMGWNYLGRDQLSFQHLVQSLR